jgi:hypothetical protein
MEIGQGPNWGCSAKGRKILGEGTDTDCIADVSGNITFI